MKPLTCVRTILLMAVLWASGAAAQTWTAQPVDDADGVKVQPTATAASSAAVSESFAPKRACTIRVRSPQRPGSKRFSATRILDLEFQVRFSSGRDSQRTVRVEVETPKGHLFQTLTIPFEEDASTIASGRVIEGYPRPLEVQRARPVVRRSGRNSSEVIGRLPVAGTSIVHSSLYGKWVARAYLGDALEPCGRARAFLLSP
jgi:hypothetical protein